MNRRAKRLQQILGVLDEAQQDSLLEFAEFLAQRAAPKAPLDPKPIPRPENETVLAAIKRLSQTYPMLEKSIVFHDASNLLSQHVMKGRDATEVIDELETVFEQHYRATIGEG